MTVIEKAIADGRHMLTEYEAKQLLYEYGFHTSKEMLAHSAQEAARTAEAIGFPVAIKGYGADLMHKTEAGAVFLNICDAESVKDVYEKMKQALGARLEGVVVSEMVHGRRELVMGLHRDPGFGPCVMVGIGGVMTELLNDTAFRVAPIDDIEALDMVGDLRTKGVFEQFRGEAAPEMRLVCQYLKAIGEIGRAHPEVSEIDVNPVIIRADGQLVAVDALVVLKGDRR